MDAGKLDKKVLIQVKTEGQDTFGEPNTTWATTATTYANINPLVGKEFFSAQQNESQISHDVTIRYRRGVKPKMRISYNDRVFEIHTVIDFEEKREWLFLKCREVVI
jgi:SPP1 family predicted phage head-tail adaptor